MFYNNCPRGYGDHFFKILADDEGREHLKRVKEAGCLSIALKYPDIFKFISSAVN